MGRMRVEAEASSAPAVLEVARSAAAMMRLLEEARDALELAIVSGAPSELVERLATVVGLSSAIADLSSDGPPIAALTTTTLARGRTALEAWREWQRGLLPRTG